MSARPRVEIDPLADEALDRLVDELPTLGWTANRKQIVSALVYYANAPMLVGLTAGFNRLTFKRDEEARSSG